ncbi:DUF3137 domain-containing protein [Microbacterium aerolatum]|uniref:DUF3137 domain-containing protein n=1 Tax=Microbacterium aerolatum TaxID=153731 RepID=UPI0020014F1C|nr:DUF3137 domain-containing protein [Microbacterium aerolatum]MCK3769314.1 DUF3137 domain-containing protein [Microbacterium aerolatum]
MTTPTPLSFDARPLTEPVDPKDVTAFAREMRARKGGGVSAGTVIAIIVISLMLVIAVPMVALGIIAGIRSGAPVVGLPFLLILVVIVIVGVVLFFGYRRSRVTRYRLNRFASANGMTYEDRVDDPSLPGMIFSIGRSRHAKQLVRGHSPRFVEFGNYQYTVKSGKNSTTYRWGYVAVKLDVPLPNIVLDALGNNGFGSNLPASFRRDQRLSLEGDFDKYFTLYCPEGYEQDALYLFTPDIMARFVDNAAELDVEIVDDWLFLYTKREASTLDPSTWAWLFGAVGALITKLDQWARWRDDRLAAASPARSFTDAAPGSHALPFAPPAGMLQPPPGVAKQGRRLKRGGSWITVAIVVVFAVGWMVLQAIR